MGLALQVAPSPPTGQDECQPAPHLTLQPASCTTSPRDPLTTPKPRGARCPLCSPSCDGAGAQNTDLHQVRREALGPQPLLEALGAAQGALQAAAPGLEQGGADALVRAVVLVLGGQPGYVHQPPALGIVRVVARVAEQGVGGQL